MDPLQSNRGRPVEVFFDGFRSDTLTLWKNGWNLIIEEDRAFYRENLLCIFKKDDLALYGRGVRDRECTLSHIYIQEVVTKLTQINVAGTLLFRAVDISPSATFATRNLWEEPFFKNLAPVKEDLIVDPLTIEQMLEEIRKQQAPIQKQIRSRKLYAHLSVVA